MYAETFAGSSVFPRPPSRETWLVDDVIMRAVGEKSPTFSRTFFFFSRKRKLEEVDERWRDKMWRIFARRVVARISPGDLNWPEGILYKGRFRSSDRNALRREIGWRDSSIPFSGKRNCEIVFEVGSLWIGRERERERE